MPMTGVIKRVLTPEVRLSQSPLLDWKSHHLLKIFGKYLVFSSVFNNREFTLPKGYQHQSMELKWTGITN